MIGKDFYRIADASLLPGLQAMGWVRIEAGVFARAGNGTDKLAIDPHRGFERFAVLVSYEPPDMTDLIRALVDADYEPAKGGFLCGPYLTPASVRRLRSEWPCRTKERLVESCERILVAVRSVAEPWLQSLRDARTLAENADPTSALLAGFAWERAGDSAKANERYREMVRRFDEGQRKFPQAPLSGHRLREYWFLADRLRAGSGSSGQASDHDFPKY